MNNTIEQVRRSPVFLNSTLTSMSTFIFVWIGQVVSILGSSMTGFALGVWIFQQTGSAFSFALILLFNMHAKSLSWSFAGVLADRYDRRKIMLYTDLSAGIATMLIVLLYKTGELSTWHIYLLTSVNDSASAIQGPAFSDSVTQLVPKAQFGRANGLQGYGIPNCIRRQDSFSAGRVCWD